MTKRCETDIAPIRMSSAYTMKQINPDGTKINVGISLPINFIMTGKRYYACI